MTTIREIAQHAGVSISTASIVLRGESQKRKISDETRLKVLASAQELNYTPNVSARRLRAPQTGKLIIAVFWATLWANEFRVPTLQFLRGVQSLIDAENIDCEIVIHSYHRNHFADALPWLSLCHGAIVCNATAEDILVLENSNLPVPVVVHSRRTESTPCVYIDYTEAGRLAAQAFSKAKQKNAAICTASSMFVGAQECEDSFIHTALKLGMSVRQHTTGQAMRDGYEAAVSLLELSPRPDCVFFISNVLALGALKGFHTLGISIPKDMSIIALGTYDRDMEEFSIPSLSTVQVPLEEMGSACLKKVVNLISGSRDESRQTMLPVHYVARESCPGTKS